MSRLTGDGTAEPVSRDQIPWHERGQGKIPGKNSFPCLADHEQNWQPYPVDPYSCYICDHTWSTNLHTYIHTYILYSIIGKVSAVLRCRSRESNLRGGDGGTHGQDVRFDGSPRWACAEVRLISSSAVVVDTHFQRIVLSQVKFNHWFTSCKSAELASR